MTIIVIMSVIHVFMVFAVDPYAIRSMVTGRYNPNASPEARNARPFYHLFYKPAFPVGDADLAANPAASPPPKNPTDGIEL